ncbi:hypothetical protein BH23THE1_BH23THE1_26250 [soil metagenome]
MYTNLILFSILVTVNAVSASQFIASLELEYTTDLLDISNINWSKSANIQLNNLGDRLENFTLHTIDNNTSYDRITTLIPFESLDSIPFLYLSYATNSSTGNPTFIVEIRKAIQETNKNLELELLEVNNQEYLWSENLGNTLGYFTARILQLPPEINNSDIQIRFYIISHIPTDAYIKFGNSTIFNL